MLHIFQVPKFKAQPLPDFHEVVLPEKKVVEPTKPEPFKLLIDERGAVKSDRWEQAVRHYRRGLGNRHERTTCSLLH